MVGRRQQLSTNIDITMNRKKFVRAVFGTSLSNSVAGNGTVTMSPAGGIYPFGTVVRFNGDSTAGKSFGAWGDAASEIPTRFIRRDNANKKSFFFAALGAGQVH